MRFDPLVVCWALFIIVWMIASLSVKPAREQQSRRSRWGMIAFLTLTFVLLAGGVRFPGLNARILPYSPILHWAGEIIAIIGTVTALAARYYLGRNWSATITFKEGHELIEKGPYRYVRHPIYTGLLLMILGTAIVLGRISSLAAVAVCFAGTWQKLKQEEALLTRHFPDTYPGYMARTKAIIPFVL